MRVHQFTRQSIGVEVFDHGVFAVEPTAQVDLLAANATEWEVWSVPRFGRDDLLADRAGDGLDHGGVLRVEGQRQIPLKAQGLPPIGLSD